MSDDQTIRRSIARTHRPGLRPATRIGLALLLVGGLAACSSDPDAASDATTTTAKSTASLPEGAEDLVGRWAHYDVVAYEGDLMKTLIISTGFADLELRDGQLWNVQRFCHADMGNDQNMAVSLSDDATQAIVPIDTPVEVTEEDGVLRVVRPATPTPIGIDLDDPANEKLPTDPDDPRINDADGDGKPGVTAKVEVSEDLKGEIYLARREIFSYDVTQESPDRMVGHIVDRSEQTVLGASNDLFLTQDTWTQIDDKTRNPVIWQRVDDTWDCERLAEERDQMFPPKPVADW